MTSGNSSWVTRDLAHVWHPCTQMKDHETLPLIPLRAGSGVWLEDYAGKRYLDAISSWWVNLFGHANATINAAVREQLERLGQFQFDRLEFQLGQVGESARHQSQ